MKSSRLASSVLAMSLAIATPSVVFAHVGHGDEFQAEGGIDRVKVNTETDSLLGILVEEILPVVGSTGVYIPMTSIVEDGDKKLVFVQYEDYYEPVPVTTGATQGELVEITDGLSIGEQLVMQGSLSLYAESRKTQTAEEPTEEKSAETPVATTEDTEVAATSETPAPVEESSEPVAEATESETVEAGASSGFPIVGAVIGGIVVVVLGAFGIRAYNKNQ